MAWSRLSILACAFLVFSVMAEILVNPPGKTFETKVEQSSSKMPPWKKRSAKVLFTSEEGSRPCIPRDFGRGSFVCVCNSSYCDTVSLSIPPEIANLYHAPGSGSPPPKPSFGIGKISLPPFSGRKSLSDAAPLPLAEQSLGGEGGGPPSYRGLVQIFTSSKTGSRLHKSIVQFNNDPEEPYRREDLLSLHDDLIVRTAREGSHTSSSNGGSRIPFLNIDLNEIVPSIGDLNPIRAILNADFPRPEKTIKYTIRRDVQHQIVLGYGGAFTDAAGINIGTLSQPTQENLMRSYFGKEGIDYSMGRVPIGGTDFSTRPYTYDDDVMDLGGVDGNLTRFALQAEDFELKIPFIQWAQSLSENKIKIVASPWSAPGWMKTSGKLFGMGRLKEEHYQLWADYFVRFLKSYKEHNVDVWGITTGNEPMNGFIPMWPFNCMGWTASMMRRFLTNNLGPSLAAANLDPRVMMLDDNKGSVSSWAKEILSRNDSAQYVHGVGTHWYLDFLTSADALSKFHESYPDYFIVQTEACLGFTPWELEKVSLGNWERGEQYLEAIIHDSRNFVGGWIDWNLALDLKGGPNWAGLKADAAILVNSTADEFLKQPTYYGIGHVSKFVPPDSKRIEMTLDTYSPKSLQAVAFLRPDNGTVIVFLNKLKYDAKVAIRDEERGLLYMDIPPQSFQTLVYCNSNSITESWLWLLNSLLLLLINNIDPFSEEGRHL